MEKFTSKLQHERIVKSARRSLLNDFLIKVDEIRNEHKEAIDIWLDNLWEDYYYNIRKYDFRNHFEYLYMGKWKTEKEFAKDLISDFYDKDVLNLEAYASDLFSKRHVLIKEHVFYTGHI